MSVVKQYRLSGPGANEIAATVERAITEGRIQAGDRLPTVRELADELQVSPATVAAAYRRLRERGIASGSGRRGTTVNARPSLPARGAAPVPDGVRNLAEGTPDPQLLPPLGPALRRLDTQHRTYGSPVVLPQLLELARTMFAADAVPTAALTVVGGALDGIERVLMAHLRPGDRVAVEDPGYANLLDLLAVLGLQPEPVEMDFEGMRPESLRQALGAGAQAIVITPRAQNPTGAALTVRRAHQLRSVLAAEPQVLVVEDDHAAGIAGADYHCVASGQVSWAVLRSMSKVYGPDLRLALMAGDRQTLARVSGRFRLGPQWVSRFVQELAVGLAADPESEGRVEAAATEYARRRHALLDALAEQGIDAYGRSGLNVWVPVPDEAVVPALLAAGWAVAPGSRFRLRSGPAIRVTAGRLPVPEAAAFAAALVRCLNSSNYTG